MRIAPAANHTTSINNLPSSLSAPSAPGLHDTLRAGVGPIKSTSIVSVPDSAHPLEARLKNWEATQETLKMEGLRRTFGMSEALRRGMELKITRDGSWKPACLGDSTRGIYPLSLIHVVVRFWVRGLWMSGAFDTTLALLARNWTTSGGNKIRETDLTNNY
jgi:proteasome maturation protein